MKRLLLFVLCLGLLPPEGLLPLLPWGAVKACRAQTAAAGGDPIPAGFAGIPPPVPPPAPQPPEPPRTAEPAPGATAPPQEAPTGTGPAPSPLPRPAATGGQYVLNFDEADVHAFLQTLFGEILRVNYVVDPRIKGRVTFRAASPVPRERLFPLLEVILRLNGIGMVEEGGLYRIVPLGELSKEPSPVSHGRDPERIPATGRALLQVVPIRYVHSGEVLKLITPFASGNAVLVDMAKGNQIIIVDTDVNVKRLLQLIALFDNEGLKQRRPQVFVYQVQNGKAKEIAALLQQIFPAGRGATEAAAPTSAAPRVPPQDAPGSPAGPAARPAGGGDTLVTDPVKIIADDITNTLVVLSTPEDYATIARTIEKIDIVPRQVVIEGLIASVSLTDNLSLGMAAFTSGNPRFGLNPAGLNVDPAKLAPTGFTFLATDTAGAVRTLITALATDAKAKVLAAPHILVSDNRDAKIQVGQQVPLMSSETYGTAGVTPQRNYAYRDIGIILRVRPRINEGGLVSLEISQEISTYEPITLNGTEQLLLNKTDASTNLVVQDGQTIVIGGLIREDTGRSVSGVPLLSRLPLIGWFFGTTEEDKRRQELIILLTPRVIKNQAEAREVSAEFIEQLSEASQERIRREELLKGKGARTPATRAAPEAFERHAP